MRDEDKPFVLYRRGPMNFSIAPRGAKGWAQLGIWMALLALIIIGFAFYAEAHEGSRDMMVAVVVFVVGIAVWNIAMIWWMKTRSEVVDLQELLKLKRENDAKRRGRR